MIKYRIQAKLCRDILVFDPLLQQANFLYPSPQNALVMRTSLFIGLLLIVVLPLRASGGSLFELLQRADPATAVDLLLTIPSDSLHGRAENDQPARISFTDGNGNARYYELKVSVRGKFRRLRCGYPPLKLNFSKKSLTADGLADFDKYKLVGLCLDSLEGTNLLLREYLAYKAQQLITPYAFRVQLLNITYRDALGVHPDRREVAFIIESTKELAARLGAEELENGKGMHRDHLDNVAEVNNALFQYLISNGDYSLPMHRNVKLFRLATTGLIVPVGYDFDFSGWVGAPYASPSPEIGQKSIFHRVYLGYAHDDKLMYDTGKAFFEQRRAILQLVSDFEPLPENERVSLRRFVRRFYDELAEILASPERGFYDKLRGAFTGLIPAGGNEAFYQSSAR